jgi:hypothetical protein
MHTHTFYGYVGVQIELGAPRDPLLFGRALTSIEGSHTLSRPAIGKWKAENLLFQ